MTTKVTVDPIVCSGCGRTTANFLVVNIFTAGIGACVAEACAMCAPRMLTALAQESSQSIETALKTIIASVPS